MQAWPPARHQTGKHFVKETVVLPSHSDKLPVVPDRASVEQLFGARGQPRRRLSVRRVRDRQWLHNISHQLAVGRGWS